MVWCHQQMLPAHCSSLFWDVDKCVGKQGRVLSPPEVPHTGRGCLTLAFLQASWANSSARQFVAMRVVDSDTVCSFVTSF